MKTILAGSGFLLLSAILCTAATKESGQPELPLPADVDDSRLKRALGAIPQTPLDEGVAETVGIFKQALEEGKISPG